MAEEKAKVEAASIDKLGIQLVLFRITAVGTPKEIFLSSSPTEIVAVGSLEILQDPEIWTYHTGASNCLTF